MLEGVFELTLEILEEYGKKFSWTFNMASNVPKAHTQIEYSNKLDTNVTTENCTFIGISTPSQKITYQSVFP